MDGASYYRLSRDVEDPRDGPVTPAPFEYMMTCPVDKNHRILNTHLMVHVAKCRKAKQQGKRDGYIDDSMQHCRFNHAHFLRSDDIHRHELECPERFDMYKYTSALNEVTEHSEDITKSAEAEPLEPGQSSSLIRITSTQDLLRKIRLEGLASQHTFGAGTNGDEGSRFEFKTITDDSDGVESTTSTISASVEQISDVGGAKVESVTTNTASSDVFNESTATSQSIDLSDDSMSFRPGRGTTRMGNLSRYQFRQRIELEEPEQQWADDDDVMWDLPKSAGFNFGRSAPIMFRPPPKMATKKEKKEDRQQAHERFQNFLQYRENNNQDGKFVTKFILTAPDVRSENIIDPELTHDVKDIPRWWDPSGRKKE